MNKKQLSVIWGIVVYIVVYIIGNLIIDKQIDMQSVRLWAEFPLYLKIQKQFLMNMRFMFFPMLVLAGFLIYAFRERRENVGVESKEHKKRRIRKFIIRETLILVVSLLFSLFCFCMIMSADSPNLADRMGMWYQPYLKMWVILLLNYPIYLFFRFIIWTIKYAKEKEQFK